LKNEKEKFNHYYYRVAFFADIYLAFGLGGKPPAISMEGCCHRRWSSDCR